MPAPVTVFGPHPLLAVTIERRGESDDVHLHPAGQGVWVARMAGELGADPVLCGFIGGETGKVLQPLLDELPGSRRLVRTAAWSGSYVMDRRSGEREPIAFAWSAAPTRHEIDDLVSLTDDVGARERGAGAVRARCRRSRCRSRSTASWSRTPAPATRARSSTSHRRG